MSFAVPTSWRDLPLPPRPTVLQGFLGVLVVMHLMNFVQFAFLCDDATRTYYANRSVGSEEFKLARLAWMGIGVVQLFVAAVTMVFIKSPPWQWLVSCSVGWAIFAVYFTVNCFFPHVSSTFEAAGFGGPSTVAWAPVNTVVALVLAYFAYTEYSNSTESKVASIEWTSPAVITSIAWIVLQVINIGLCLFATELTIRMYLTKRTVFASDIVFLAPLTHIQALMFLGSVLSLVAIMVGPGLNREMLGCMTFYMVVQAWLCFKTAYLSTYFPAGFNAGVDMGMMQVWFGINLAFAVAFGFSTYQAKSTIIMKAEAVPLVKQPKVSAPPVVRSPPAAGVAEV